MHFVPDSERLSHPEHQLHKYRNTDTLHRLAIMDSIMGNNDRHGGNVLMDTRNNINLVDNANAFDYAHRVQTPIPRYAEHILHTPVPESTHKWIQELDSKLLTDKMIQSGAPSQVTDIALKRLAEAKRWSRVLASSPGATPELAGALQVIQSHRFGDQDIMSDARSTAYNRIKRGEALALPPVDNTDKTQIHGPDNQKR